MNFKTYYDLNHLVINNIAKIPNEVDLVVGIPRSGVMLACIIALYLNLPITSMESFLEGKIYACGKTKSTNQVISSIGEARKILVVDDSINSGKAINTSKNLIKKHTDYYSKCIFLAAYVQRESISFADIYFEICNHPRMFEWNYMHNNLLKYCCVDIDGVLCVDPSEKENDDGENYKKFLLNAKVKLQFTKKIGWLITSRLEKYRTETEIWLNNNGINYEKLIMMNIENAETRRSLNNHAIFKAEQFKKLKKAMLFIESEEWQAEQIYKITNKSVFCIKNQLLYCDEKKEKKMRKIIDRQAYIKKILLKNRTIALLNQHRKGKN